MAIHEKELLDVRCEEPTVQGCELATVEYGEVAGLEHVLERTAPDRRRVRDHHRAVRVAGRCRPFALRTIAVTTAAESVRSAGTRDGEPTHRNRTGQHGGPGEAPGSRIEKWARRPEREHQDRHQ